MKRQPRGSNTCVRAYSSVSPLVLHTPTTKNPSLLILKLDIKNLMVSPTHQRRGIGRKLLSAALHISDNERMPTFLISSAEALSLYNSLGFQQLGTWTIDNAAWAARIAALEKERNMAPAAETGLTVATAQLEEQFRGIREVESYMVRWPVKG
jgi:hypothetical protein